MRRFKKFEDGHNELAYLDLANNRQDMWQRVCISACLSGTMVARLLLDFNHHNCIFVESTFLCANQSGDPATAAGGAAGGACGGRRSCHDA